MTAAPVWDAQQYMRFKKERAQPFHDLIARVPSDFAPSRIADLGCGDGELTRTLLARWPTARIWGVDNSREMLEKGMAARATLASAESEGESTGTGCVELVLHDLRSWQPPDPLDLIVSNAALHWVDEHPSVLRNMARQLAPGGTLALQVPNNGAEAAYRILEALLGEAPWRRRLGPDVQRPHVESPSFYERELSKLGFDVEVWETTYYHRLAAAREIVEWVKGTSLRPVLTVLSEDEGRALLQELTARIDPAYPADAGGVLFPFRRLFFVAALHPESEIADP